MSDYDQLAYNLRNPLAAYFPAYATSHDLGRGTAFPTTGYDGNAIVADDRFYRTDLDFACVFDGTHWLTTHEYEADLTPYVIGSTARITVTTTVALLQPMRTDYHAGLTRIKLYCDVLTTNNGTNFWTFVIGTNTTTAWSPTTAADAPGTAINKETAPGTDITGNYWSAGVTKTGTPGSLAFNVTIYYRLIVT
jgi:hypothetical protein